LAALLPIAALCLWIGVYPKPVLDVIREDVQAVARIYEKQTNRPQVEPRVADAAGAPERAKWLLADGETR
jgi:hypothetical protein